MQRLARARALMKQNGIGALIVEPGASLDYFTGVQWWRSERLTAAVIPVQGDPIIVTPFFEKPSVEESLKIPAEVRVWQEDEEPLKLVAEFLKERGVAGAPVGFEETNRYWILDRLRQQLPDRKGRQRQPGRAGPADAEVARRARADAGGRGHHGRGLSRHPSEDPRGHDSRRTSNALYHRGDRGARRDEPMAA